MSRFFTLTLVAVLLCLGGATQGQGYSSHWIFGSGFHLEVVEGGTTNQPIVENFLAYEGASTISDTSGELLFYSNTIKIWNKHFLPLLNSDTFPALDLPPASSKANGSLFVPWPGDSSDRYFAFFSMNDVDDKLYLSKIDRFLDSGLGGIVDSMRYHSVWDEPIAEQLNAVKHANGRDLWIVARKGATSFSNEFIISLLTPEGIFDTSVQSNSFYGSFTGCITFSKGGDLMAMTHTYGNCFTSPSAVALYSFDRCEGRIELIDTLVTRTCGQRAYGVAFSPDASRLYYSSADKTFLYQVSLIGDQLVDTLIFELKGSTSLGIVGGNILLGDDDKIYVNYRRALPSLEFDTLSQYLGVIRNPNAFGLACQFDTFGLYLGGPFNVGISLPNFANYDLGPLVGSPCDTLSPQDTTQTGLQHPPLETLSWSINPSISSGSYTVTDGPASWLVVHDLYGREVLRQWHEERSTLDLTGQPSGVYLVYLRAADGTQTLPRKIVLQ